MKLYLVHCGYYDRGVADGIFEFHTNYFIAAQDFEEARLRVKEMEEFKRLRMHVDGMAEINAVAGHRVVLEKDANLNESENHLVSFRHRELAKK